MAVKTLVLGFGGTGTHILTYLKELSIYKHGRKPDHLVFIELDTIARALWKPGETVAVGGAPGARETIATGLGQEKISLDPATEYLALEEAHPPLRSLAEKEMSSNGNRDNFPHLKDWLHTDWLKRIMPPAALNVESGAAQQRQIGRFGMVGNVRQITNAIRRAFEDLRRAEPNGNVVRTWLICSSAGGTGAGCIIDGAAMVRMVAHQFGLQPTVTGIIALPEVYAGTAGVSLARAFSFFRELERFQGIGLVTPTDEIATGDPGQPTAWSLFNYDREGNQRAIVPARLFDYLFYLGENCPDLRRRISFFNSVSTAVDTFLDDNIGSGMMEELINQDGHPLTFGGSRLSIPLNTYSELFVWEQAIEYLRAIGAPVERSGEAISRAHWGSDADRQDAAIGRVDSLLPLFADVRAVMIRDRRQWPNYVERELAPQTIVKKWYQFAEPALSGVDATPDQLLNDIPLTYCNPFIFLGDDEDSIRPEDVEVKTYGEASKAKHKESQSDSISRFSREMSDRLDEYTREAGGKRSFASGRALVRDSITRLLNAKIDDRLTADINGFTRVVGDPEKPTEGTQLTRLYRELQFLTGDSSPLDQIQDVLTQFSQHLDEIIVRLRQEAVNEIQALKDARAPSMAFLRSWADGPQVAARDKCMDYIRIYQKQQLIHDMRAIVTRVKQRFTEWLVAVRDALASTVMDRGDQESVLTEISREHRDRLLTRLQRLARDERTLISLAPRRAGDDVDVGMNGFAEILRRRSIESSEGSLANGLALRSRWTAAATPTGRPRIALSIKSDDAGREVEVRDLSGLDEVLHAEFASTIKQRLSSIDIFDYLLYERDTNRLSEKDVAERLISTSRLLLAGPPDGSARWVYANPNDRAKDSYTGALQNQLNELMRGNQVKSAMDLYSDRLSLTLLRDARREHGQIDDIVKCHDNYMQVLKTQPGSADSAELERALVYHPFRGEADAWLMERLRVNSRFAGVADSNEEASIPPRVTRLLDQPEHFQAFVSCLATQTVRRDLDSGRWQWHTPDRSTPVDLGAGDITRAAVTFCLWRREFGDRAIYRISAAAAMNSARRAAAGRAPDTGANRAFQDELRAFAEPAALDAFLAVNLEPPRDVAERQAVEQRRLTAGLKMAIQFYCDPNNSPNLPERRI